MKQYFPGIADDEFIRGSVPMTKQEIRIMVLAKARIGAADTVVDIGAGTGSISIEAAFQAQRGTVYAVEKNPEGVGLIQTNCRHFGLDNVRVIHGEAPEALDHLPKAHAIIVGGSGGHLPSILERCDALLYEQGRLIVTAVTLETLLETVTIMTEKTNYAVEASSMQVTRLRQAGTKHMFDALNPVFIISCIKAYSRTGNRNPGP